MLRAALAGDVEDVLGGLIVDVPRVLDAAGARGEAGDHDVEASAVEGVVADGVDGRHRAELDGGVGEERARLSLALLTTDAGLVADERGDIVALRAELADDELADVAGAAHDQHLRGGVLLGNVRDGGSDGEHAARGLGAGALRAAEGRGAGGDRRAGGQGRGHPERKKARLGRDTRATVSRRARIAIAPDATSERPGVEISTVGPITASELTKTND